MRKFNIKIREGSIAEAVALSERIPEFVNPHKYQVYQNRMKGRNSLILIAEVDGQHAGFKVGYDKFQDGSFYSWMGGVLSDYRQMGIAKMLALKQEEYALKKNYSYIMLKTRNRHINMLLFALSSGFKIVDVIPNEDVGENRILLKKDI